MRAGASAEAARRFTELVDDPSVGEDATYWAGICFAKAGERVQARNALQAYLDRFPEGLQRGRAHLALGRLWRDTDKAKALLHFERAANDPDGGVANVAIDEMTALRGR